ncbi:MAG TPA: group I intron-associated PD-(D/E)XK endonuclease [Terriglobales bacterium]|nr:group I intron-associated PD-(D/E)XK endonuclease [Terriglobales bacterium]
MGHEMVIDRIMAQVDEEWEERERKRKQRRKNKREGDKKREEKKPEEEEKRMPPKRLGELAELAFLQKAIRLGFLVSKPWGDSDRYDAVADWKGKLYRVQVRSTEHLQGPRGFAVHASVYVGRKIVGLTKKDIDVLAAYIFPKDLWYMVPVEKFVPRKNLWFYPDGSKKGAMFEKFREAWEVMKGGTLRKKKKSR